MRISILRGVVVVVGACLGGCEGQDASEEVAQVSQAVAAPGSGGGGAGATPMTGSEAAATGGANAGSGGAWTSNGNGGGEATGGATGGGATGGGATDCEATGGAGCGDDQPTGVRIPCGGSHVVKQGENRALYASVASGTEAGALAKCQAASWWATSGYVCSHETSCQTTPAPHCKVYFGPDAFETTACTCRREARMWLCSKTGEVPVNSTVECFSCYQTSLLVPCGEKAKFPATLSTVLRAVGHSYESEQKAKEACESAPWRGEGTNCDAGPNNPGPTPNPTYTVDHVTPCVCEQFVHSPVGWRCERTAVAVDNSDIDCTHCTRAP